MNLKGNSSERRYAWIRVAYPSITKASKNTVDLLGAPSVGKLLVDPASEDFRLSITKQIMLRKACLNDSRKVKRKEWTPKHTWSRTQSGVLDAIVLIASQTNVEKLG